LEIIKGRLGDLPGSISLEDLSDPLLQSSLELDTSAQPLSVSPCHSPTAGRMILGRGRTPPPLLPVIPVLPEPTGLCIADGET